MRLSGDYGDKQSLTRTRLLERLRERIRQADIAQLREEVSPFVRDQRSLDVWSHEFFLQVIERIEDGSWHQTGFWPIFGPVKTFTTQPTPLQPHLERCQRLNAKPRRRPCRAINHTPNLRGPRRGE